MTVTFLRHCMLNPPFDNYDVLSIDQLSQLSLQEIDPAIDKQKLPYLIDVSVIEKSYDTIFHSPSLRAKQTAQYVGEMVQCHTIIESREVREIVFDPKRLVTQEEFLELGLQAVRNGLFHALETDSNYEHRSEINTRLHTFFLKLSESAFENVLIVTHGFLLRIIELGLKNRSIKHGKYTYAELTNATNYSYCKGFTIENFQYTE